MTSTLLFGGTFDPVHRGHIESVCAVQRRLGEVKVFLVPCQIPAHRPVPAASPEDRLAMLELAISDIEQISVDDCELKRQGTSYTFDTLCSYRDRMGASGSLIFMMGFDAWLTLPTWHRWQELADLAHLLVIDRPGARGEIPASLANWKATREVSGPEALNNTPAGKVCFLSLDPIDISASQIRSKVARGDSIDEDVSPDVASFIRQHHLYTGVCSTQTPDRNAR